MKELLVEMIKAIVDKPDEVDISLTESENTNIYELEEIYRFPFRIFRMPY